MGQINRSTRFLSILRQLPCPRRALDLGCGGDNELAEYLTTVCNDAAQNRSYTSLIVSVDRDLSGLRSIRLRRESQPLQADLAALPFSPLVPFDLILIRHPDIDRARTTWKAAFGEAPILLNVGGILLTTTYSPAEMDQIHAWLKASSISLYPLAIDQLTRPDLVGRDRFVGVYKRKG